MHQFGQSGIITPDNESNEFLSNFIDYEVCPFCSRSFFRGKLAYHLKHCSLENPMLKNKKQLKPIKNASAHSEKSYKCDNCNHRIPFYLASKHKQQCLQTFVNTAPHTPQKYKIKVKNYKADNQSQLVLLPKLTKYQSQANKKTNKNLLNKEGSIQKQIRVRQQLSCFKIAQQVQKTQCQFCGRKFSISAGERHIPICSLLKFKQRKLSGLKDSKNLISRREKQKIKLLNLGKSQYLGSKSFIPTRKNESSILKKQDVEVLQQQNIGNPEVAETVIQN